MMKLFLSILSFGITCSALFSQDFQIVNQNSFGGNADENPKVILECDDGSFIVGSQSRSGVSGNKTGINYGIYDLWIVKLNTDLTIDWQKSYGGSESDYLAGIIQDDEGNFYVAGTVSESSSGNITAEIVEQDYFVVKLDSEGNEVWQKAYGANDGEVLGDIVYGDGKIYLSGSSSSGISGIKTESNRGETDFWVVCINKDGEVLWDKTAGGNSSDQLCSASIDIQSGNLYVVGVSLSSAGFEKTENNYNSYSDLWLVKMDCNTGSIVLDQTFGTLIDDQQGTLIYYNDNIYFATTATGAAGGDKTEDGRGVYGENDFWVLKFDSTLAVIWDKTIGGIGSDGLIDISLANDGNIILTGNSNSPISFEKTEQPLYSYEFSGNTYYLSDYWLVAINNNSNILWDKTIGGVDVDGGVSTVYSNHSGNLVCVGTSSGGPSGDKTSIHYGGIDIWAFDMKLPTSMSIVGESDNINFYPNPASDKIFLNNDENVDKIEIYSTSGVLIKSEKLFASKELDVSGLTSGVYLVKLWCDDSIINIKLVIN